MVTKRLSPKRFVPAFTASLGLLAYLSLVSVSPTAFAESLILGARPLPAWTAKEIAVIVNDDDKLSVQIAEYYQSKRGIPPEQVIHVRFKPGSDTLSEAEFKAIKKQTDAQTPAHVQGYVLTWLLPYKVDCMSITTAFAAGFDPAFCASGCKETRRSPYLNSVSSRPFTDFAWRPTMMLAAKGIKDARELIDRGIAADYSQPKGTAYLLKTTDAARSSRAPIFPEVAKKLNGIFSTVYLEKNFIQGKKDIMFYFTGLPQVQKIRWNSFLPGAIADHLTSTGGMLPGGGGQMPILEWLEAGATGTYGTVVEPCNFPDKFSNPGLLMAYYLRGNSLVEAYWKSVAEPGQGIFVGEPLARPFARQVR